MNHGFYGNGTEPNILGAHTTYLLQACLKMAVCRLERYRLTTHRTGEVNSSGHCS